MKALIFIFTLIFVSLIEVSAQTEFELDPSQSMLMTGKGPGQDATINPYEGEDCYAVVENKGDLSLSIRIQNEGKIIEELIVPKMETKKVKLPKGCELYLDPNSEGKTKAVVSYEKSDR